MKQKPQRLTRLEFWIMEILWSTDVASIREVLDSLPLKKKPSYVALQTTMYRMEAKGILERTGKVGNFHMFRALLPREEAQKTLLEEMLSYFGGESQPVMAYLVKSGKLSLDDVKQAEQLLRDTEHIEKPETDTKGKRA